MAYSRTATENASGQTAAITSPEDSASWIRDAVTQSEQSLSEVHEQLDYLERRLDTALTPVGPSPATALSAPPKNAMPSGSHLRGRVMILNEGWQHAIERIAAIRQRIEI